MASDASSLAPAASGAGLRVEGVTAGYGTVQVLHEVSIDVPAGRTMALLGTNGNGKTTLIRCVMGMIRPTRGRIVAVIDGEEIDLVGKSTEQIVELGIALVPEGRRLFPRLSVHENLLIGAYPPKARAQAARNLELCYEIFPRLRERHKQFVGSMSGGEQQMVALGRALMSSPRILVVDEPSVGLAPVLVARTIDAIAQLKQSLGLTVLMAEQNFHQAVRIADGGYVIVHGHIEFQGRTTEELRDSDVVRDLYMGA